MQRIVFDSLLDSPSFTASVFCDVAAVAHRRHREAGFAVRVKPLTFMHDIELNLQHLTVHHDIASARIGDIKERRSARFRRLRSSPREHLAGEAGLWSVCTF